RARRATHRDPNVRPSGDRHEGGGRSASAVPEATPYAFQAPRLPRLARLLPVGRVHPGAARSSETAYTRLTSSVPKQRQLLCGFGWAGPSSAVTLLAGHADRST